MPCEASGGEKRRSPGKDPTTRRRVAEDEFVKDPAGNLQVLRVQELQLKFAEEIKRGDRAEFEKERNAEKLSLIEAERISLQSEREALKETVEELTFGQTGIAASGVDGGAAHATRQVPALLDALGHGQTHADRAFCWRRRRKRRR